MALTKTKLHKTLAIGVAMSCSQVLIANAASIAIENPGFESSFTGWSDTDPSAISSDEHSGSKAAKITGSAGKFEQSVTVTPNTDYVLSAYIKGSGKIGATVNGTQYSSTGGGSSYEKVSVSFNSGSASSVTIFGSYYAGEGRFDDFTLETSSSSSSSSSSQECTANDLTIVSATDDGTNDGHVPANTIDDDTSDESRWSSKGIGKTITYDLGGEYSVQSMAIKWYKGNSRNSYFSVDTSTNNSAWTSVVVDASSSGNSSSFETVDLNNSTARYNRQW